MDVAISQLLSISIVGVLLSLILEWYKAGHDVTSVQSRMLAVLGAVVLGAIVWALQANAVLWQTVLGVLASASTVYSLVIKSIK